MWINPYLAAGSDLADWAITHGVITVDGRGEPLGAADNSDTLPVDFYSPDARQWSQDRLARTIHAPTDAETYTSKPLPGVVLGRTGTIGEAADAVFWLRSPLSNYVTGQMIPVNGGAHGGMS